MNFIAGQSQPFLVLIDDDPQSARLATRMLLAHGAPSIEVVDGAGAGEEKLAAMLGDTESQLPGMVIVDLKSTDARGFIERVRALPRGGELLLVAMSPAGGDGAGRDGLVAAGASAVFSRHADNDAYRREAANVVSFWVRNQHLKAIGT